MSTTYQSNRRDFLRASGIALALPALESFAAKAVAPVGAAADAAAKRIVCIGSNLGFYRKGFYPTGVGRDYEASTLLQHVDAHRVDYTVFSGLDHRGPNGHKGWDNFLCGNRIGQISLDQIVTEKLGNTTRIPSLQLCAGGIPSIQKMSFARNGVPLPMINRPSAIYRKLFASASDRARTEYLLKSGQSALDAVKGEAKSLQGKVGKADKDKLDEYFISVREVEKRMQRQLHHLSDDVPEVDYELPPYDPVAPTLMLEAEDIMYDLIALAFQTDSTRVATIFLAGLGQVFTIDGQTLRAGYHALSHHGGDKDMVRDLLLVEAEHMKCFNRFLSQLKTKKDVKGQPLLDSTIVLFGSGMGDASTHNNTDIPTLVAGGGFNHGTHVKTDRKAKDAHLLGDLYLTMLHQLGIDADRFANATRPMAISG